MANILLGKIIDGSCIPSFVINKQHKVVYWNTAMEALSGIKREQMIGTDLQWKAVYSRKRPTMADLIIDGADTATIEAYYKKSRKTPLIDGAYDGEDLFPDLKPNGKWLHFTASPIRSKQEEIIGSIETLEDITERKIAEQNLRYYLHQVTRAQEEERKRIARDLHDGPAQSLTSIIRQMDNYLRKQKSPSTEEVDFFTDMKARIDGELQDIQRFSQGLRPPLLNDLGLIPALRSLAKDLQERDGIDAAISVLGEEKRLSPEVELPLFRIIQEALNNVRHHSEASEVRVEVDFTNGEIQAKISDNGRGFELAERLDYLPHHGKLGLAGMQERVELLGGTIEIQSNLGKGTNLKVKVPSQIAYEMVPMLHPVVPEMHHPE
jgi:PAS domain S-box-containing protein